MESELLVKCLYNKETRCVRIREGSSYKVGVDSFSHSLALSTVCAHGLTCSVGHVYEQDLQRQLEKEFKFAPVIKYKDPEGDKVSMKKQGDFEVRLRHPHNNHAHKSN
jgi:hypothetical protein